MTDTQNYADQIIQFFKHQHIQVLTHKAQIINASSVLLIQHVHCEKQEITSIQNFAKETFGCRKCSGIMLKQTPTWDFVLHENLKSMTDLHQDELWRPVVGGWVSSYGKAMNSLGKVLTLDTSKDRYNIGGSAQYRTTLLGTAFRDLIPFTAAAKLQEDANKNKDPSTLTKGEKPCLSLVDKTKPISISNLIFKTHQEACQQGNHNSRQSERFKAAMEINIVDKMKQVEYKQTPELPDHLIFQDGNVYNHKPVAGGQRFLAFTVNPGGYLQFVYNDKVFFVHRLVCCVFNPLQGKTVYDDYKDMEVNHKDGNHQNNCANNLEWVTHAANMSHAYQTDLNKKVRGVLQYKMNKDGTVGELIKEHKSIAEASRQTGVAEHVIRSIAQRQKKATNFDWRFKDESLSAEWSLKFAHKTRTIKVLPGVVIPAQILSE